MAMAQVSSRVAMAMAQVSSRVAMAMAQVSGGGRRRPLVKFRKECKNRV